MRGRPPKPTALKIAAGNPGKRPLNDLEPVMEAASLNCPTRLKGDARKKWNELAPLLHKAGVLKECDRDELERYCKAWQRYLAAEKHLDENGEVVKSPNGYPIQNPYLSVSNKAWEHMEASGAKLGMNPSDRSRLKVTSQKQDDPFESYLRTGSAGA